MEWSCLAFGEKKANPYQWKPLSQHTQSKGTNEPSRDLGGGELDDRRKKVTGVRQRTLRDSGDDILQHGVRVTMVAAPWLCHG